jgi:CubicO group peptidase (beta-lactamase class C family)
LRPIEVHPDFREITLKNLLTHHAGFPNVEITDFEHSRKGGRDALMRYVLRLGPTGYRQESKDAPFCFNYSNVGYAALGEILERISDPPDTFDNLLRKNIFIPLGIEQCRLITRKEALEQAGLPASSKVEAKELDPLITPAAAVSCTLDDWMAFTRYVMHGMNGKPSSQAVLRKPRSFEILKETQEKCYYATGALMFSKKPSAAYHFGGNGVHSSLVWFELGQLEKGKGTSFIVVSTEPFHEVFNQFFLLARLIQEKTSPSQS